MARRTHGWPKKVTPTKFEARMRPMADMDIIDDCCRFQLALSGGWVADAAEGHDDVIW